MNREISLPYGKGILKGSIPQANLVGIFAPAKAQACADPSVEIARALVNPIGGPPLADIVRPGERVTILVDDHTRATPAADVLPLILGELDRAGVAGEHITILITHGTHRLSTEEEVRRKVGSAVYGRWRIVQHDCTDDANHVFVGLTSRGTPVWINRWVAQADRRVGIGHIGPSPYAGYSGGLKLIVPGAAALDTINANHSLVPLGFRRPGRVDVPCRLDLEEAAGMVGLDFVVDLVLCQDEQIARALAGEPHTVFREGVALARQVYEVDCPGPVDIAITSAFPYDIDLYQAVRAIEYADAIVREGGSILLAAACPEGVGGEEFRRLMVEAKRPEDFLRDVARRNGKVTFGVLGYALARIRAEKRLAILSDGIPAPTSEAMGLQPVSSLQEGIDRLLGEYGPQARVAVFPAGSATIPRVD